MPFCNVTREKSKLRLALMGASGTGKTLSALYIAYGITGDWGKIALIDTEHGRAKFYANRSDLNTGTFLYQSMNAPYTPAKYIQMVQEGEQAVGADGVVIIDSFSHAWDNEGGVLDINIENAKRHKGNSFQAWNETGKIQNKLVNTILSASCHTIVTMRTKTEYAVQVNEKGKSAPVKIGLAPVQRDNVEYEFDIVMSIDRNHIATTSKDTTFLDNWEDIITPDLGKKIIEWLDDGVEPELCEVCHRKIEPCNGRSIERIVEGSVKNFGKKMCFNCSFIENQKAQQAKQNQPVKADINNNETGGNKHE